MVNYITITWLRSRTPTGRTQRFRDCLISDGISFGRIGKYLTDLKKVSELLRKNYSDANEMDIRRIVSIYERDDHYSQWSKRDFRLALRKFYTWLRASKEYPPEVSWMRVHHKIRNSKTHEDLLTEEEIKKLIEYSPSIKEKAFISTLYESGCRIGEIIYLKINQITFDDYGAQLFVTGKTGFRRVRVVACAPYIVEWINNHPTKDSPKSCLWLNSWGKPYSHNGICSVLSRAAQKAKINKRVNPHNFRHSRASYLANFLTEAQMKEYFG